MLFFVVTIQYYTTTQNNGTISSKVSYYILVVVCIVYTSKPGVVRTMVKAAAFFHLSCKQMVSIRSAGVLLLIKFTKLLNTPAENKHGGFLGRLWG